MLKYELPLLKNVYYVEQQAHVDVNLWVMKTSLCLDTTINLQSLLFWGIFFSYSRKSSGYQFSRVKLHENYTACEGTLGAKLFLYSIPLCDY